MIFALDGDGIQHRVKIAPLRKPLSPQLPYGWSAAMITKQASFQEESVVYCAERAKPVIDTLALHVYTAPKVLTVVIAAMDI